MRHSQWWLFAGNNSYFAGIAVVFFVDKFIIGKVGFLSEFHSRSVDVTVLQLTAFETADARPLLTLTGGGPLYFDLSIVYHEVQHLRARSFAEADDAPLFSLYVEFAILDGQRMGFRQVLLYGLGNLTTTSLERSSARNLHVAVFDIEYLPLGFYGILAHKNNLQQRKVLTTDEGAVHVVCFDLVEGECSAAGLSPLLLEQSYFGRGEGAGEAG